MHRFHGTSAAAPAAAGVAALLHQQSGQLSARTLLSALQHTAARVGSAPARAVGAGLVNARRAVAYVAKPSPPRVTSTRAKVRSAVVAFAPGAVDALAAPPTSYTARCVSDRGPTRTTTRAGTSTAPLAVTGLRRGKTYRCKVRAASAYTVGDYSVPGAAIVARGVPGKPKHVTAQARRKAALVSFRAPDNTGGRRLLAYAATCTPTAAGRARTTSGTGTTVRVAHLRPGVRYRCVVAAVNKVGTGRPAKASEHVTPHA